ncbi:MAG TPA: signal peptidase II [Candidatus Methylomirabilis sp.]|nr:signal peptidase II [Candidatus Methylomirabilis sp.]
MSFYLIALAVLLLDQATKQVIIRTLRLGEGFPIVPGYFDITFVLNPGAAFSFLATLSEHVRNPFFIAISITAIVLIVIYHSRFAHQHRLASLALSLILGGATGNLVDRLRYGVVVDFLDVHIHQYHWPVFNVADSAISVGVGLMLLEMVLDWRDGRKT